MKRNYRVCLKERKRYVSPVILVFSVNLEGGIAAVSAEITSPANGSTPEIEDWVEKEFDGNDWQF